MPLHVVPGHPPISMISLRRLFKRADRSDAALGRVADSPESRRTDRQRRGVEGEAWARAHLEAAGLVFVDANVRYRDGELDLVMRDGERSQSGSPSSLVFVEVRRRASGAFGGAAASVTGAKKRRLIAAAEHYLATHHSHRAPACRFDIVTIEDDGQDAPRIVWLRDAFGLD